MKIVIPGGSGQVGTILARYFHREEHDVVVLSRNPAKAPWRTMSWDGRTLGDWTKELENADAVINLAGRSVNCRYNATHRREILDSRVTSTTILGEALSRATHPPRVWLQASTATIYTHRLDAPNDEFTGTMGGNEPDVPETWRFSIDVATAWERAAEKYSRLPGTREVLLRSAITMSPDRGGPFDVLLRLVRLGLGGRNGSGRQYVSWIHETDFIRAIVWLIEHDSIRGAVNLAAPNPFPNADFMRALRHAWGISLGLPSTEAMLEIGAVFLRTETELILKSRRVEPARLLRDGFKFRFPDWPKAAADLCARWRATETAAHR